MDSSIIYVAPHISGIWGALLVIALVFTATVVITQKMRKKAGITQQGDILDDPDIVVVSVLGVGAAFIFFLLGFLLSQQVYADASAKETNNRIAYFNSVYDVHLTPKQMGELQYPATVPARGEAELYGSTVTLFDNPQGYQDIVSVYLIWDGERFVLADTTKFSADR